MNKVYMHYEENKPWYDNVLLLSLLSFVLWGFYKNGVVYYLQGNMNLLSSLKPLLFPIISIIFCFLSNFLEKKKIFFSKEIIIEGITLGIMMPPRMSFILYISLLISYVFLKKFFKNKWSFLLLFKICSILCSHFILMIDYQNSIEASIPYLYGTLDTFLGRSVGGIGTTSIFLLIIYFFIKVNDFYYKKELPIYIISSYSIFVTVFILFFSHENLLLNLLNSHVYFMSIFLATIPNTSPAEKKHLILYGVILGFMSFLFQMIFHFPDGIYLSLFVLQIVWYIFSKFLNRVM